MTAFLSSRGIVLDPILPIPLVLFLGLVLGALTFFIYVRIGAHAGKWKNALLLLFRLTGTALLLAILLQPSRLEEIPPPTTQKSTLIAIDTSRSMKQADAEKFTRLEAAKNHLLDAELIPRDGVTRDDSIRLFHFSEDASAVASSLHELAAEGATTRFHRSITTLLNSLGPGEGAKALIILSDGHDFEMVNPSRTGFSARSRQVPIYAVPVGRQGKVRDVSVRITSYQPYCYVKQKARISAMLRLVGCEYEDLQVQLLRQNEIVQTQRLNAEEHQHIPLYFEVLEPEVGQFEYEIRAIPLPNEVDLQNNSAITYLNVIDQQIKVLLLEGAPYWDTTFLQRSLMRNDKINLDLIAQYAPGKARLIRKESESSEEPLRIPATDDEFNAYDVIILGRSVDQLFRRDQLELLENFARDHGGTVIFSRGRAFEGDLANNNLEPVVWQEAVSENVRLQIGREGQSLAPFRLLAEQSGGMESVPELIAGRSATEKKPLTATLASVHAADGGDSLPGIVHRRFGQGQVLSVGVDGLWRWAFNAKVETANTLFDRFWDQMILWLMAGRDFLPNEQFSLRSSSANILLGEKIYFRVAMRNPDLAVKQIPMVIYHGEREAGRTTLNPVPGQEFARLTAEFLPEQTGRYRAVARFPDGTSQESRFIVFEENLEETEVITDATYLKRLSESSGGRLLTPPELAQLAIELRDETVDTTPKTRLVSIWDQASFFYLIGLLFGADWFLRRRWGLC
jgi:hypothetical protein